MLMNAVSLFGNVIDADSSILFTVLTLSIVLLLGIIIAFLIVTFVGVRRMKKNAQAEEEEEIPEEEPTVEPVPVVVVMPEVVAAAATPVAVEAVPAPVPIPAPVVAPVVAPVAAPVEEESVEGGALLYNKSFLAKYIQSDDETKSYYVHLKNEILSYKKIHERMSWKREAFRYGKNAVVRMSFRGKTLCLYFAMDPALLAGSKYHVEDVSDTTLYEDTPCLYRILSERREKYAMELIAMVMEGLGVTKTNRPSEDYYLPYEGIVQLIDKGLVKRQVRNADYISSSKE